jgi:hypothetical protein
MPVRPRELESEHSEQAELIKWCVFNEDPRTSLIFAIPNGGFRTAKTGAKLRLEGLRPGIPDLMLPVATAKYHGLFIELKTQTGKPSPAQKEWIKVLNQQGYLALVAKGADEAIASIQKYLNGDY